jgi:hypothetical protein
MKTLAEFNKKKLEKLVEFLFVEIFCTVVTKNPRDSFQGF